MTKIFADTASLADINNLLSNPTVAGFTCNPTIMRNSGVTDYAAFSKSLLTLTDKPVSLEVFADDFENMERQAKIISSWGAHCYVKIPIMNTKGESSVPLIGALCRQGVKVNVTAVFTRRQIEDVARVLIGTPAIISIFAGRIADTGISPQQFFILAREVIRVNVQTLWASTRELYNIKQAKQCGADIITVPNDLLKKMHLMGKDLNEYSRETVQMFYDDAKACGFTL